MIEGHGGPQSHNLPLDLGSSELGITHAKSNRVLPIECAVNRERERGGGGGVSVGIHIIYERFEDM